MNRSSVVDKHVDNLPVISVGELAYALKRHIEQGFETVRVQGEITGFKRAASGHLYFSLKDAEACLDSVCWRAVASRLSIAPADGIEIVATGRITTYPDRSKYQLVVEHIELAGEGALLKLLEERRRRLAEEGLFDAGRKRPIPLLPDVIGVVTSPSGAVIRDILHRLDDRFPRHVLLWPVLVQGTEAATQIAAAITGFNALPSGGSVPRPDLLIVARGGGSLEDLWAFNEEIVVRAAATSSIPLISAVGHETDWTLIDHAADLRAPTPTAAAEMAVPVRIELAARLLGFQTRLAGATSRSLDERRSRVLAAARGLPRPQNLLLTARQRLDDWGERLRQGLGIGVERRRRRLTHAEAGLQSPLPKIDHRRTQVAAERRALDGALRALLAARTNSLQRAGGLLASFSYEEVLRRGFALILDADGHVVSTIKSLRPDARFAIRLTDGDARVRVIDRSSDAVASRGEQTSGASEETKHGGRASGSLRAGKRKSGSEQGSLF
ncbi:MAG: exodeoxyribonuclease VII large subunit [Rhodospirillales bacterium]|nr:exodeoxyribonuclease VII large subunit [Rhodospirillales bacterium]